MSTKEVKIKEKKKDKQEVVTFDKKRKHQDRCSIPLNMLKYRKRLVEWPKDTSIALFFSCVFEPYLVRSWDEYDDCITSAMTTTLKKWQGAKMTFLLKKVSNTENKQPHLLLDCELIWESNHDDFEISKEAKELKEDGDYEIRWHDDEDVMKSALARYFISGR